MYACNDSSSTDQPPPNVTSDSSSYTQVQWIDTSVNFGSVVKGQMVHIKYHCKNVGSKPLFIYYVRPSCGCTVADYTKSAIAPGKTGEVSADFDSNHGTIGEIRKSITVQTNTTNASPRLLFNGIVTSPGTANKKSS